MHGLTLSAKQPRSQDISRGLGKALPDVKIFTDTTPLCCQNSARSTPTTTRWNEELTVYIDTERATDHGGAARCCASSRILFKG